MDSQMMLWTQPVGYGCIMMFGRDGRFGVRFLFILKRRKHFVSTFMLYPPP